LFSIFLSVFFLSGSLLCPVSGHDFLLSGFIFVLLLDRSHNDFLGCFIFFGPGAAASELLDILASSRKPVSEFFEL